MTPRTSASIVVLTAAAAVFLTPADSLLAGPGAGKNVRIAIISGVGAGPTAGLAGLSLADVTEAAQASSGTAVEGTSLQDVVDALGESDGTAVFARVSFLNDPEIKPRALPARPPQAGESGPEASSAEQAPVWSIDRILTWAKATLQFGDWLPSTELGSGEARDLASVEAEESIVDGQGVDGQGVDGQSVDGQSVDGQSYDKPAVTLTDVMDAALPEPGTLADLSAVAFLLQAPDGEASAVSGREAKMQAEAQPEAIAPPPMRVERVAYASGPRSNKPSASPYQGPRYDGFIRALAQPRQQLPYLRLTSLQQPAQGGRRLPIPTRRPFDVDALGFDITPGTSADSLASMLERVGTGQSPQPQKVVAFNDVVDNATETRTLRGLYKSQRKREAQARRGELVDALRQVMPSDNASLRQ